jgi:hypothetical protein
MTEAETRKMRDKVQQGFEEATKATVNASQRATRTLDDNVRTFADMSTTLTSGVQELSREWWMVTQQRMRTNMELLNKLLSCRTLEEAISIHSELAKSNLQQPFEDSRRLMDLSLQLMSKMASQVESNAERATEQVRRAA